MVTAACHAYVIRSISVVLAIVYVHLVPQIPATGVAAVISTIAGGSMHVLLPMATGVFPPCAAISLSSSRRSIIVSIVYMTFPFFVPPGREQLFRCCPLCRLYDRFVPPNPDRTHDTKQHSGPLTPAKTPLHQHWANAWSTQPDRLMVVY
jgi:hypothetical protein